MPAPDPATATRESAIAAVRDIYRELENRPLERHCIRRTACCQFQLTGKIPQLTRGEALVTAKALRATGRKALPTRSDAACPLLDPRTSRCLVYEARPFGCRTHFCAAAGGTAPRATVLDLIRRLEAIDQTLKGDGPHPLPQALEVALGTRR